MDFNIIEIEREKNMKAKISIVMSTYNETIEELNRAIDSMLNQTFKDFEFIIVLDNPRNEEHKKIINEYAQKDKRIVFLINEKNIGLAASLNKGIDAAQAKYIARMDADDISMPERLEKEYVFLENNLDVDIVSTNKIDINEEDEIINIPSHLPTKDNKIKDILKITSIITHSAAMFRKEQIEKIGKYRLFPASQDYDLWLRASYYKLKFAIIDEQLIMYRIRKNNISNTNPLKQYLLREYIQKLYKQRLKKGTDDFSLDNLQKYLDKNKAFDEKEVEKYRLGMQYIDETKKNFKEKKIIKAFIYSLKALFAHKKIKYVLYSYIVSYLLKVRK